MNSLIKTAAHVALSGYAKLNNLTLEVVHNKRLDEKYFYLILLIAVPEVPSYKLRAQAAVFADEVYEDCGKVQMEFYAYLHRLIDNPSSGSYSTFIEKLSQIYLRGQKKGLETVEDLHKGKWDEA